MYGLWGLSAGLIPQNHQGSQNFVFFDVSHGYLHLLKDEFLKYPMIYYKY